MRVWPGALALCRPAAHQPPAPPEPETQATPSKSTSTECVEPDVEDVRRTAASKTFEYVKGCSTSRMSVTATAERRPETPPPTCQMKRQSFRQVAVWPSCVGWKLMIAGWNGSFMSTLRMPFLPESLERK